MVEADVVVGGIRWLLQHVRLELSLLTSDLRRRRGPGFADLARTWAVGGGRCR